MTVQASELSIVYGGVTFGGSTARQITEWTKDEHDYVNGSFEFEFITTASTDSAFATELDTVRDVMRKPRQDLTVTQNASTILSRKHSLNTGLNTYPSIVKDGDPADTGRSRHFRCRITYELPADNLSQDFRRISITGISYSLERRRTVTIEGEYTANSSDGTTAADTQYFAQIATAETTLLAVVDATATWERVGQPDVRYSETRKIVSFTRIYKEVNVAQSLGGTDDADIIDPHMEISVEQIAPGDSLEAPPNFKGGGGTTTSSGAVDSGGFSTQVSSIPGADAGMSFPVLRPVMITVTYEAGINFATKSNQQLQLKWNSTIRPWIINRASAFKVASLLVAISEKPAYEIYENHIQASMTFIAYYTRITRQLITYGESQADGFSFAATTSKDPFEYYEFPGPAIRQLTITEDREEIVDPGTTSLAYEQRLSAEGGAPGSFETTLGDKWRRISRDPKGSVVTKGLNGATSQRIGTAMITTTFQYRNLKAPSVANAGGVTGNNVQT